MKTLPFWLGRLASVRVGAGGKNCDQVVPMAGKEEIWMDLDR
jgi:hypothetical protein